MLIGQTTLSKCEYIELLLLHDRVCILYFLITSYDIEEIKEMILIQSKLKNS
jgi:hypothetical protein